MRLSSYILKLALFATGLSGIVAEYILSTLATYFIGDSVLQWTLIVSIMMFSMGLGSNLSQYIRHKLVDNFIAIEFVLSILVSFSSLVAYSVSSFGNYTGIVIYSMSILIGILIGMEIPLVIRLNNSFQILRVNVASIVEKDYYGSLVGGLFYAFVGLPVLGLTYTPFILGFINFSVALTLLFVVKPELTAPKFRKLTLAAVGIGLVWLAGVFSAQQIVLFGEQLKYKDKVIYAEQSKYQKIVITEWKDHHWLYLNGNQQLSTLDEVMYHEPLVHPVMSLSENPADILVLGGGDGAAVREVLKYKDVETVTVVDLDPAMTKLGLNHPVLTEVNDSALHDPRVTIKNMDGYQFLEETRQFFDLIIIDLPDPKTVELGRLYSYEFYKLSYKHLRPHGLLVTQAGSPYYATKAFLCIHKTIDHAGFATTKMHNQILTLGEWGWVIGAKMHHKQQLRKRLLNLSFREVSTEWINRDAMKHMLHFGKVIYPHEQKHDSIEINKVHNPVLYRYYLRGNWDIY